MRPPRLIGRAGDACGAERPAYDREFLFGGRLSRVCAVPAGSEDTASRKERFGSL